MTMRLLLAIIGLVGLGLWVPQGCAGGPETLHRLAQVQKKAPATNPIANSNNNEALDVDRRMQPSKVSASPDRDRLFSVRVLSSQTYRRGTAHPSHQARHENHR